MTHKTDLRGLEQEGVTGLVGKVIASFLCDTPVRLAEIRTAAQQGDARLLRGAAHTLKGSGACVGAITLVQLSSQIEDLAAAGRTEGASLLVDRLDAEYVRVRQALEQETRT